MSPVSFGKFDFETMQCFYIIMKQQDKNSKHNENIEANWVWSWWQNSTHSNYISEIEN